MNTTISNLANNTVATRIFANAASAPLRTLTEEEIKMMAPHAFATAPTNPDLSKYYTFASTEKVIEDMKTLGWNVVDARQPRRRNRRSTNSYHMITFQNADESYKINHTNRDGEDDSYFPQVILTNSHDGFSSFCFRIAIYQPTTGRQFIISTETFNNIYLRHMGYSFEELQELISKVMVEVPTQVEVMNKMQNRILSQEEKYALALAAIRNRQNDMELEVPEFILDEVLEPAEYEHEPENLWETFAIITHKMVSGCFYIQGKKGLRKARKINGIWKYIHHNQALFQEAAKMI